MDLRRHGFLRRITSEEQVKRVCVCACAICMQHANRPLYSVCLSGRAGASCFPGVPGLAKGALCMRPCRCRRRPGITKQAVRNDRQCHRKASARPKFHDQDECGWQASCSGGGVHSGNIQRMLRQWMDGRDAFAGKSWLVLYQQLACINLVCQRDALLFWQGVVNMPYERYFVPVEVSDRNKLTQRIMLEARIFNLHVQQQCSRLILGRSATCQTIHRFAEGHLCKTPAASCEEVARFS